MYCLLVFFVLLVTVKVECKKKGDCFRFTGRGHLKYYLDNVDIAHSVWYKLNFKTEAENGLLLYAEGSHDYEAIFLHNGKINYMLYNPTYHGGGGTYGAEFESDRKVNNNTWITVEVFRNREPKQVGREPQTGMVITSVGGGREKHVDSGLREDVQITLPIFIAGVNKDMGLNGQNFIGDIKDIREKMSDTVFYEPSHNSDAGRCLDIREPQ